jgi:hypothetical protein
MNAINEFGEKYDLRQIFWFRLNRCLVKETQNYIALVRHIGTGDMETIVAMTRKWEEGSEMSSSRNSEAVSWIRTLNSRAS